MRQNWSVCMISLLQSKITNHTECVRTGLSFIPCLQAAGVYPRALVLGRQFWLRDDQTWVVPQPLRTRGNNRLLVNYDKHVVSLMCCPEANLHGWKRTLWAVNKHAMQWHIDHIWSCYWYSCRFESIHLWINDVSLLIYDTFWVAKIDMWLNICFCLLL